MTALDDICDGLATGFGCLAGRMDRLWVSVVAPLRPVTVPIERAASVLFARPRRWHARRRTAEMDSLAAVLDKAGLSGPAGQIQEVADRWRART